MWFFWFLLPAIYLNSCASLQDAFSENLVAASVRITSDLFIKCHQKNLSLVDCVTNWELIAKKVFKNSCRQYSFSEKEKDMLKKDIKKGLEDFVDHFDEE